MCYTMDRRGQNTGHETEFWRQRFVDAGRGEDAMGEHTRLRRNTAACLALACLVCLTAAALALSGQRVWPEAAGVNRVSSGNLTVDYSNARYGYFMAKGPVCGKKLKLRVSLGEQTMTYDLNSSGEYEVFPLQLGSGSYQCVLYQNASGKKYAQDGRVTISVSLEGELAPFLCPNQYVDYTAETQAVLESEALCAGLESDRERFEAVREYIRENYVYDYVKAATVTGSLLPDIDGCYEKKMGICQDLAAMAACMLRVQGIPAKLVVGYVGKDYHAWNLVTVDGEEILYDPTKEVHGFVGNQPYTVERFY